MGRVGRATLLGALNLAIATSAATALAADSTYRLLRIDGTLVRWAKPGSVQPMRLRYTLIDRALYRPGAINCRGMAPVEAISRQASTPRHIVARAARLAFDRWQAVTPIVFEEVASTDTADVLIGTQLRPRGIAFADITLGAADGPGVRRIERGAICLNPARAWSGPDAAGSDSFDLVKVLSHEIGHILGLDHPNGRGHLMSFRYQDGLDGLTQGDMDGIRAIYGTTPAHRAGDSSQGPH